MFKKIIYNVLMLMLVVSSIVTALGIAYLAEPDFFNWLFDWLDLTEAQKSYFITGVGGTTIMGWGVRVLRTVVNSDALKRDALHQIELNNLEKKHNTEMELLKSDFSESIKVQADSTNEIIATLNILVEQNKLLISEREANAERMIAMSDTLVPKEVKDSYNEFLLSSRKMPQIDTLKHFYVENVQIIKEIVKPLANEVRVKISERVSKNREKSKAVSDV